MNNYLILLAIITFSIGASTVFGASAGVLVRKLPHKFHDIMLGTASGIMLAAAVLGLIAPAVECKVRGALAMSVAGVFVGAVIVSVLDKIIFVADYVEAGRTYYGCIRVGEQLFSELSMAKGEEECLRALNRACLEEIDETISSLSRRGQHIDARTLKVRGVIAPLLELGAGFDMNYSGAENIYLYGATMGYSKSFIKEKYDEIVEFSELGEFINSPMKSYSSGMKTRLGFSIATAVKPDVLILDEVLSVGDAAFKEKSEQRIMDMMADGVTVLYVSHSTDRVRKLCNKALILTKGQVVAFGDSDEICDMYTEMVNSK